MSQLRRKKRNTTTLNTDELFPVDASASTALATTDKPREYPVEVISANQLGEQVVYVAIGECYIPAPEKAEDGEEDAAHPRQAVDPAKDAELDASIREHGILIPLIGRVVIEYGIRRIAIIKGSRRLESARRLGLSDIPIILRDVTRAKAFRMTYAMTAHNQTLSPIEKGLALVQLHKDMVAELRTFLVRNKLVERNGKPKILNDADWQERRGKLNEIPAWIERTIERAVSTQRRAKVTGEELAAMAGCTPTHLSRLLKAAKLPLALTEKLSFRQAQALSYLQTPQQQARLAREIQQNGLSGEEAVARARQMAGKSPKQKRGKKQETTYTTHPVSQSTPLDLLRVASGNTATVTEALERGEIEEDDLAAIWREADVLQSILNRLMRSRAVDEN